MTEEQMVMISLLNGSNENFTKEIYDYIIQLLKDNENNEKQSN